MLTLDGWDLLTIADVKLVNAALKARHNELITSFDYKGDTVRLTGSFGSWQIRPGGSVSMLEVALPIDHAVLLNTRRRGKRFKITGVTLIARLSLSLLPIEDTPDTHELRFDFDESAKAGDGVFGLDIEDPDETLTDTQRQVLKKAAAACLAVHASDVSYVFASVKTRGSTSGEVFDLPHHDWANIATADGRHYLAIAGAFSDKVAPLRNIDPGVISTKGSSYLAFSQKFFTQRLLLPVVQADFRPKSKFAAKGKTVVSTKPINLGKKTHGIWSITPIIRHLSIFPERKSLAIGATTTADLPLGAVLTSKFEAHMAFKFDPKTRSMTFKPDPKPTESHEVTMGVAAEILLGWLIRLIVMLNSDAISGLTKGMAKSMQTMTTRTVGGTGWTGVRDFELGTGAMDGVFVMTDTRPA